MTDTAIIELNCPNGYVKIISELNVVDISSSMTPSGQVTGYRYSPYHIYIEGHGTFEDGNITSINIINAPVLRSDGSLVPTTLHDFNSYYRTTDKGNQISNYLPCTLEIYGDSYGEIEDVAYQLVLGQQILYDNIYVNCYSLVDDNRSYYRYGAFYNINGSSAWPQSIVQNSMINVHCHRVGRGSFYSAHVNTIVAIADEYGSYAFEYSDIYHAQINPDVKLPSGIFIGCSNLINFSFKEIQGTRYINYVHDMELFNGRGASQFQGCDSITVFSLNKLVDIDWASTSVDYGFKVTNPYVVTDLYTNSQTIKDNAYRWHSKYGRDVDASHIHDMPNVPDGKVWNIVDQGAILGFDPQQVQDNNCIYMMHEGALVKFKLVLPSDPLASNVYIKHNGVLMCLANN